jgi:hypothetical protein
MEPKVKIVNRAIKEPNLRDPELTQLVKLHLTAVANGWKETAKITSRHIERLLNSDNQGTEPTEVEEAVR